MTNLNKDCAAYISGLNRGDLISTSHHELRILNDRYGAAIVQTELDRQFQAARDGD